MINNLQFIAIIIVFANKIIMSLTIETLLGDDCICEGRCSECIIGSSDKLCRHCTGYFGTDIRHLRIDALYTNKEPLVWQQSCVCPAGYQLTNAGNYVSYSSEVTFVRLQCGHRPIDDRFCIGINPQIFFIGSNSDKYWLIIAAIPVLLFLCCSVYSMFRNKRQFPPQPIVWPEMLPLSSPTQIRDNANNYCNHSQQYSNDVTPSGQSSLPPPYEQIIGNSVDTSHQNLIDNSLIKQLSNLVPNSSEVLPTYEDAIAAPSHRDSYV